MRRYSPAKQHGQVLVLLATSMLLLVSVVGFAIDSGLGYMVKTRLNAAVDSASIAAARAVTQGNDQSAQVAYARLAAQRFFAANYPDGYLNSRPVLNEPAITFDRGKVTLDLSAQAALPASFMGILGFQQMNVSASAQSVRKDLDLALVMDTSGSLKAQAAKVRSSAISFLEKFSPSTDRVGLIHFAYGAIVDDPIRTAGRGFDRNSTKTHINDYVFEGSTNSSEGMWHARDQLNSIAPINRSTLRVIVFFSDGSPNSFASFFPFKNPADCAAAGTISTGDGTSASSTSGLYRPDRISTDLTGACSTNGSPTIASRIARLPDWYNAHNDPLNPNDPARREFPIVTNSPRQVTSNLDSKTVAWRNINRASRNLVEAMAAKSRDEGMYVFTLGLGPQLLGRNGPDNEKGEDLLKCMANTPDAPARCYNPQKPVGIYCYAETENDLNPCFSRLASEILRITR
jgi:Flp pilus assembly protein TadG